MSKYSRQEKIIGKAAQQKLQQSKVTIIGVGALGTVVANLLARAGIGELILIDRDVIEESNIHRQILFTESDIGKSKALAAKERLSAINSEVKVQTKPIHLNAQNIYECVSDLIIDCTDNFKTRFLINDFCKKENLPWIYGSAIKTEGQVMAVYPEGPCIACFLKETRLETCEQTGVLNTITTIIGSLQTNIAVQIVIGKKPSSELHYSNLEQNSYRKLTIKKNPLCPACQGTYNYLNKKDDPLYVKFCSSGKYQVQGNPLDLDILREKLSSIGKAVGDQKTLTFQNMLIFADGRALITAKSKVEAQVLYSKYIGN